MRKAGILLLLFVGLPALLRGPVSAVEVTVKIATPLRDARDPRKVIAQVPAGAAFEALAVVPNWVLGTYKHEGVLSRGFIVEDAVLEQDRLAELRERYRRRAGARPACVEEMLALPDEEIDIGLGALLIGKEYDPKLDVPKYHAQLDRMAVELRARIGEERDPRKLIGILNDYIFAARGYAAVGTDEARPEHYFLHVLLKGKKGTCATLSALYLALAERLGLPLFGVCAPGHVLVRYESGETKFNVEPTQDGARHWDVTYALGLGVPATDAARSFYMRSLTKRQFLGVLLSNLGAEYADQGKFREAVAAYRKVLVINPNDAQAWYNLGVAYRSRGEFDDAVQACRKALSINPEDAKAWSNLGVAYTGQGKLEEAVQAHRKALAINPDLAEAWNNLGVALESQGKLEEAVQAHRKALAINPDLAEAWNNLGVALESQRRYEEAVEAYRKALTVNPNYAGAWTNLGLGLASQRKFDEAVQAHRKALAINPKYAEAWGNLGVALQSQGKFDEAVQAHRKALAINPNDADAWNNLAVAHYARGDYRSAWECVRKCQEAGGEVHPDFLRVLRQEMREPRR